MQHFIEHVQLTKCLDQLASGRDRNPVHGGGATTQSTKELEGMLLTRI